MIAKVRRHVSDVQSGIFDLWLEGKEYLRQSDIHTCFESVLTGNLKHLREGKGVDEGMERLNRWQR